MLDFLVTNNDHHIISGFFSQILDFLGRFWIFAISYQIKADRMCRKLFANMKLKYSGLFKLCLTIRLI
jgi:hypothetical protein